MSAITKPTSLGISLAPALMLAPLHLHSSSASVKPVDPCIKHHLDVSAPGLVPRCPPLPESTHNLLSYLHMVHK
uniref:Secreted protein n=1 Tax=Knipowitschia caucasica TaxID=637954 RepID=A0AAV2KMS8_KNICA